MKKDILFWTIIIVSFIFLVLVINHSVYEIHYLKSFFPDNFTVEQAKDAAIVELIKIFFISIPILIIIWICLNILRKKQPKSL